MSIKDHLGNIIARGGGCGLSPSEHYSNSSDVNNVFQLNLCFKKEK